MHARRKGISGSKKPAKSTAKQWVTYSREEIEELIIKLAKEGHSPSRIGLILRDQHGIPDVRQLLGAKVTKILEEKELGLPIPEDLQSLINKAVLLDAHLQKHIKDNHNKRGLILMESKIRRLSKYYMKSGKLPEGWRYDIDKARLLVSK